MCEYSREYQLIIGGPSKYANRNLLGITHLRYKLKCNEHCGLIFQFIQLIV